MKKINIDVSGDDGALVAAYAEAAMAHGLGIERGDFITAKRQHDIGAAVSKELKNGGAAAQRRLLQLLNHESPWVRCWAASDALDIAPDEAQRVLEGVAALPPSLARLTAETILTEWQKKTVRS